MYNALIVAKYYVVLSNLNILSTGLLNWEKPHSVLSLIMYNRYIEILFPAKDQEEVACRFLDQQIEKVFVEHNVEFEPKPYWIHGSNDSKYRRYQ